jgi:1,4-alpha-glucan branching enzyme
MVDGMGRTMEIPAPLAGSVHVRYAPLIARDKFDPASWASQPLAPGSRSGWWRFDPAALGLGDGDYEYEFVLNGAASGIADPYAWEITRFGGYRGVFRLRAGAVWETPFRWDDELLAGRTLPQNNQIVIYEMPLRWMASADGLEVDIGTFDEAIFARLDDLQRLGVNAIELLPIMDSPDTLNWGYGNRFFFTPDIDMGGPVDAKLFVKRCHQRGIRVILDVVMNHARECPLQSLADKWFFLQNPGAEEPGRGQDWGARMFRFVHPAEDGSHPARDFLLATAEHWIEEYHVDGFRIDEFAGINNWDFVQSFRERAWAAHQARFPGRPFIVIAEDSGRRAQAAQADPGNPSGRKVVDAIWGFHFQDEARRLFQDAIVTRWGQPSRRNRIEWLISGRTMWDNYGGGSIRPGFGDLSEVVNYLTSHDVEAKPRLMNALFGDTLRYRGLGDGGYAQVRAVNADLAHQSPEVTAAFADAIDWVRSAFAILLTSVGIPMFLAGEEFADIHDLDYGDYRLKMSDPVNWFRADQPARQALREAVSDLVALRTSHAALQRNEADLFYAHPGLDADGGERVFAYARTGGQTLGRSGQVVVVANAGPRQYARFDLPWPWAGNGGNVVERGSSPGGAALSVWPSASIASLSLGPFQARVFTV